MDVELDKDGQVDVAATVKRLCRDPRTFMPMDARVSRSKLTEILSDESFYRQVVAFSFLEDSTLARLKVYRQLVADGDGSSSRVLAELMLPFLRHAQDLRRKDPSLLLPLGDYLQTKLGKEPVFQIGVCGPVGCFKIVVPTSDNPEA